MSKHTPGPWRVEGITPDVLTSDNRHRIVQTTRMVDTVVARAEQMANARLIAAAPEMRASIERMITALEECEAGECEEVQEARALLARIDGENT